MTFDPPIGDIRFLPVNSLKASSKVVVQLCFLLLISVDLGDQLGKVRGEEGR